MINLNLDCENSNVSVVDAVLLFVQHIPFVRWLSIVWSQWRLDGSTGNLIISRAFLEYNFGFIPSSKVLTYVAEVTEPRFRGMLAATGPTSVLTGILSQFVMGAFLKWRTVALLSSIMPTFTIAALCFVPESPYWLIQKGRVEDARKALAWLRGWVTFPEIEKEFSELYDGLQCKKKESDDMAIKSIAQRVRPYTKRTFVAPFALISFSILIGHFSGQTALQTYAVQIFRSLKAPIDEYYATIFFGAAELSGAMICVFAVRYTGKRPLAFVSLIGCGICFLVTATYASIYITPESGTFPNSENATKLLSGNSSDQNHSLRDIYSRLGGEEFHWLPLSFLLVSALFAHAGFRLIPWMMIGEVFPTSVRSGASGIVSGLGYFFGFLTNKVFLAMVASMTLPGTFWFNSVVSLVGCLILYFTLPETEGKTLFEIEPYFTGKSKPTEKIALEKTPNDVDQKSVLKVV